MYNQNSFSSVTSEPKKPFKGSIQLKLIVCTSIQCEVSFLRFFESPIESLRFIILDYMFQYTFTITTTLLESLGSQKSLLMVQFRQNQFYRLCFNAKWFLTLLGAPNEFLRLIKVHYTFKYSFRIKTMLLHILRNQRSPLKVRFR